MQSYFEWRESHFRGSGHEPQMIFDPSGNALVCTICGKMVKITYNLEDNSATVIRILQQETS